MGAAATAKAFEDAFAATLPVAATTRARRAPAETGERRDRLAVKFGLISDAALAAAYADWLGSPVLTRADYPELSVAADRLRP